MARLERGEVAPILEVLGRGPLLRRVGSRADLLEAVRRGLPFAALERVMDRYGISRIAACRILQLSARNFARRKEQGRLSAAESDRLCRLARVLAHADRVLGQAEESADWIRRPNVSLGKHPPLDLLDTDLGVQQVDDVLGRIEHGIVG